jgi:hypothetical protein
VKWRIVYATTLVLLLAASSSQAALVTASYYPRYAALAALAIATLRSPPTGITTKTMPRAGRLLTNGMVLAVGTGAISCTWSADPIITGQQTVVLAALAAVLHGLLTRRWAAPRTVVGDVGVAYWVLAGWLAFGLAGNYLGLAHTVSAAGFDGTEYVGLRYQGLAGNPNMLSVLCTLTIPLGWYMYRQTSRKVHLLGAVPAVVSLVMSQSRTALVAVIGAGVLVLAARGPSKAIRWAATFSVVAALAWLAGAYQVILSSPEVTAIRDRFVSGEGGSALNGRDVAWSESVRLLEGRPVSGFGYSAGPSLFQQLRAHNDLAFGRDVVHNSYLQWALETGVIGFPALAFLVAGCLVAAWVAARQPCGAGLAWCIVAGLIMQMAESLMLGTGQVYPAVFWVAVAAVSATKAPESAKALTPVR